MPRQFEILLETRIFQVHRLQQTTEKGDSFTREIVRHPGAVAIIAMVDDSHVCLIRNFRISVDKTLYELPAGTLEVGEDPRNAAERELIEETGYRSKNIEALHQFYLSPGILDERMYLFLATDLTEGETAREQGEQIENVIVPWQDALTMIDQGEIEDAKTIVGLLYCDRLRRS